LRIKITAGLPQRNQTEVRDQKSNFTNHLSPTINLPGPAPALCIAKAFMLAFSRSPKARFTPYAST
jgi:hypothetical protein